MSSAKQQHIKKEEQEEVMVDLFIPPATTHVTPVASTPTTKHLTAISVHPFIQSSHRSMHLEEKARSNIGGGGGINPHFSTSNFSKEEICTLGSSCEISLTKGMPQHLLPSGTPIDSKKSFQNKSIHAQQQQELLHRLMAESEQGEGCDDPMKPKPSKMKEDFLDGFSNISREKEISLKNIWFVQQGDLPSKGSNPLQTSEESCCTMKSTSKTLEGFLEGEMQEPFDSSTHDCIDKRQVETCVISSFPFVHHLSHFDTSRTITPIDPHSYTDASHPLTKHVALLLFLDFSTKTINGSATLTLERAHKGEIFLDSRDLTIEFVEDSEKKGLQYFLDEADAIKGSRLRILLEDDTSVFSVSFKTSPYSSALQWLEPYETTGGKLPYVFTQCQTIHARSIFPCQDTPIARIKYSAKVNIPSELCVVMSASHVGQVKLDSESRVIESFVMEQPIPPYLFALAAGDITCKEVGPRTKVYAEPSELKVGAYEFANIEDTMKKVEDLFGPYDWERFDLLVMPPSFPYGGMENPNMVFLNPTIIVGDQGGVGAITHELAHSWAGNLIGHATANDFWLNKGFTTYVERRIIEAKEGEECVAIHIGLGWQGLIKEVERFKDRPEMTKLKMNLDGVDPDEIFSRIPYEKGFQFLRCLEHQVGRSTFDEFLKSYISKFRFQSIDTNKFLVFLKEKLPKIEDQVDLDTWIHGIGIPNDVIKPKVGVLERVLSLADGFQSGERLSASETEKWEAQKWIIYIERLPRKLNSDEINDLEGSFHFAESKNWEIKIGFLTIAAFSGHQPLFLAIESALHNVGRMKYLKPLYQGLAESSLEGKELAKKVFAETKTKYHPITQLVIQGLISKYTAYHKIHENLSLPT